MSDVEWNLVEAMSPQEAMAHMMAVQARQRGDPTNLLIESGCVRVNEEKVDTAARENEECAICCQVHSGSCFSLSACPHFFHGDCLRTLFDHFSSDEHVLCPKCRTPHVTMGTQGQAQLLADYRRIRERLQKRHNRLANRLREMDNAARTCQPMVRYFLARKHFKKLRYKVVMCQSIVRRSIATKKVATQRVDLRRL